jgi:hypothetical protein
MSNRMKTAIPASRKRKKKSAHERCGAVAGDEVVTAMPRLSGIYE